MGESKSEGFIRELAYIFDEHPGRIMRFKESLERGLNSVLGYPFEWKKKEGCELVPQLKDELNDLYMRKVRSLIGSEIALNELRKLWRYDYSIIPVKRIRLEPNAEMKDLVTGQWVGGLVIIESPHALLHRFKGVTSAIREELNRLNVDWFDLREKIDSEGFDEKASTTSRFVRAGLMVAEEGRSETGVDIRFSFGSREIILFQDYMPDLYFYIVFPYKDLPLRKLYNRIILGVKVMKRTWNRWVKERLRICREIGMSEELFALRDILEVLLDLPIWAVDAEPGDGGRIAVDTYYVNGWLRTTGKSKSGLDWHVLKDRLVQVELGKHGVVSFFSPPVDLFPSVQRAIARDAGISVEDLKEGPESLRERYYKLTYRILKEPMELKAIIPSYFLNKENLTWAGEFSPSFAELLKEVIKCLEEVRNSELIEVSLQEAHFVELYEVWKAEPRICKSINDLEHCMKCSIRLDFKSPSLPETIKRVPIWLEKCIDAYRRLKSISEYSQD
jgi:hypothetical protein